MAQSEGEEFRRRIERVETLVREIERSPDAAQRARVREIVQAILELHGAGLERLLEHVAACGEAGQSIIDGLARDDLVGSLLLLHGLHPFTLEERVGQALDGVRPRLRSHGAEVEVLEISGDTVRLRIQGGGHGCSSSGLKRAVEEAVCEKAPDVASLEIEEAAGQGPGPAVTFVPVDDLLGRNG